MFQKTAPVFLFIFYALFLTTPSSYADQRAISFTKDAAKEEKRIAVLIGNSNYNSAPLKNPVNDTRSLSSTLRSLGFKVHDYYDLSRDDIKRVSGLLSEKQNSGGTALFYYAGHGIQSAGNNYMIPVNADIKTESDLEFEAVSLDMVFAKMEQAGNRVNIVILDACRNNPFSRSYRTQIQGLATVSAPAGSFIAYATSPGKVAADGEGDNSIFTSSLINVLEKTQGIPIEQIFKFVRSEVRQATGGEQIPWTSSSMEGDFFFTHSTVPKVNIQLASPARPQKVRTSSNRLNFFTDNYTGIKLAKISAGCFMMGSSSYEKNVQADEIPLHRVCLGEFYIGTHEVTQGQWTKVMGINPSAFQDCGADCPVENISWNDTQAFITKLNKITGKNFRLPTEAEWEFAAKERGQMPTTPQSIEKLAWYKNNAENKTHKTGGKAPNSLGLYDTLGNVQEWCSDNYEFGYYSFSPLNNPQGAEASPRKVLRGGSWVGDNSKVRLTNRRAINADGTGPYIGFRLVMTDN
ncbi:peptidase C14 caspase catalytic subunit p20 [Denitrovibrio acetiphilus DSM 12809]|uniref:Peptidase C14 caspase catalytic subunit p20 n=1 Tax=Denitrovibrio acetiphilus (strain DSM 12809 / NBRC 114555 / N2460) TaxID=522772 RepID=D4H3K8_DENA2|nr:caspase family protein [Denitrovibrio acetiphilus]ADD69110.1 peptidase C14 caspase catalytic subunit p20 [Denitrovibrio acetiphilus DSM 12809]